MIETIGQYGYNPDLMDWRDYRFAAPVKASQPMVDLRPQQPDVLDQLQLGSCTGNGISNDFKALLMKENLPVFQPSRLFIYYNERAAEGTIKQDAGAQIRDGFKSIATLGVCDEAIWKYDISKFAKRPPASAYKAALAHTAIQYQRIDNGGNPGLDNLRACLAEGYTFVFGFSVYSAFESATVAKTGILNMPKKSEKQMGGHCTRGVGYDDDQERFIIQNSWGAAWGKKGYFTIPYAYLSNPNLADDFWTLRLVK